MQHFSPIAIIHGAKMKSSRNYLSMAVLVLMGILVWQLAGRDAAEVATQTPEVQPAAPRPVAVETETNLLPTSSRVTTVTTTPQPDTSTVEGEDTLTADAFPEDADELDAQQEFEDLKREMFDDEASAVLPLLTVQTFRHETASSEAGASEAPEHQAISTNQAGPFGRLAPPDGHIWIRIDANYAQEHKDIMAQTADLYRAETGTTEPVTVMLWVGGRPYKKQVFSGS